MNSSVFSGRLTADIETRAVGEHQVHHFTVAVNTGNERVAFIPTEAWNMPHLERHLGKGSRVLVRGAIKQDNWESTTGEKRSRLGVTALQVEFIDSRREPTEDDGAGATSPDAAEDPGRASRAHPARAQGTAPRRFRQPNHSARGVRDERVPFPLH